MFRSMLALVLAFGALGPFGWAACGSDAKTPQAALQKLLDAAAAGNAASFREGFPSREELSKMFDCPAGVDLAGRYAELSAEFVAWRDARPVIAADGVSVAGKSQLMAGEAVGGCTARQPLNLVRAEVRLTEGSSDKRYAMRFVELDGKVRVLAF
jgi:hypothetical protein